MLNAFIDATIKANQEIYAYITTHISSFDYQYSDTIGVGGDNSLQIDLVCEEIFIKHLQTFGDIFSEEIGLVKGQRKARIIIDPLDGSSNFKSNVPYYGTSVALEEEGKVVASMVCNLANHTLIYRIHKEEPIELDLLSLKKLPTREILNSELSIFEKAYSAPKIVEKLHSFDIKFRSLGAVAISLAYARNYAFVLFNGKIREFDIKAALHICDGLNVYQNEDFLIVSKNIKAFNKIKEIIKE